MDETGAKLEVDGFPDPRNTKKGFIRILLTVRTLRRASKPLLTGTVDELTPSVIRRRLTTQSKAVTFDWRLCMRKVARDTNVKAVSGCSGVAGKRFIRRSWVDRSMSEQMQ
jgi:hypothetical protein